MLRALAPWLAIVISASPAIARACDDCSGVLSLEARFTGPIPADGVLSFRYAGYWASAPVTLRRADGVEPAEVAVALELIEEANVAVVRPLAPLDPGVVYRLSIVVDDCLGQPAPYAWDVEAGPPGSVDAAPPAVNVAFSTELDLSAFDDAEVVCCEPDDFSAAFEYLGCGFSLTFGDRCTSTRGHGRLIADVTVDAATIDPAGQIAYIYTDPAEGPWAYWDLHYEDWEPFCVIPTAIDLVTGVRVMAAPICPDAALVADLGEHVLDPRDALSCSRPFSSCDESPDSGEPECSRWRSEDGCGCVVDDNPAPFAGLIVVVVVLVGRRRRLRPGSP